MHCVFCEHAVAGDLVRVVNRDWQHLYWQCADDAWCSLRASEAA